MFKNSQESIIGGWEELLAAVRQAEAVLPNAGPHVFALQKLVGETKEAKARKELHAAGHRRATQELQERLTAGNHAASRLRHLVKAHLGIHDERLSCFGMTPVRKRCRAGGSSRRVRPLPEPPGFEPAR
jgi:hypothetical protein